MTPDCFILLRQALTTTISDGNKGLTLVEWDACSIPFMNDELKSYIVKVVNPTIDGLRKRGINYGFMYFGLMVKITSPRYWNTTADLRS